jgi:zinc protease
LIDGVNLQAFERIKRQLRAAEIYARDDVNGLARTYGSALTSGLTVDDVQAWPQVLQDVTPEDIMAAARDVLVRRNAVTGWLLREDPKEAGQ